MGISTSRIHYFLSKQTLSSYFYTMMILRCATSWGWARPSTKLVHVCILSNTSLQTFIHNLPLFTMHNTDVHSLYAACLYTCIYEQTTVDLDRVKLFCAKPFSWFQGTHENIFTGELRHVYNMANECERACCIHGYHVYWGNWEVVSRASRIFSMTGSRD